MKRSLRSWLWRVPIDQEVDEEIAFHIEMRTRELIERGVDPTAARELVLARLGDVDRLKRSCREIGRKREREMRLTQWLEEFRDDVRFAIRQLKAAPGFTFVAALTLALGIGANSAMFALADATLLRPLPYPEPERLVMIWERNPSSPRMAVSGVNLQDWDARNRSFQAMAAIALGAGGGPLLAAPDGTLQSVDRQQVSARFFDVLGVRPIAGRTFLPSDAAAGPTTTVVMMSEGLWRTRFGGDPTLIGRDIRLNGQPFTVVGIVPDNVQFSRPASIWSLFGRLPPNLPRGVKFLQAIARLKPGVSLDAAQADLTVIADSLARSYPDTNKDSGVTVEPLRTGIMGSELQLTSIFLLGVVGFVLLMCCANVANLLLARASVRGRELALRSALGAGRSRIVAQLLTEGLVLATLGGVIGVAIGAAILKVAPTLIPAGLLPTAATVTFDARVALFCGVAAAAVGVLFGLVPAWQATSTSLVQSISSEGRSTTRGGGRFRSVLVAGEVATAVLLLCGAGLLLRTLLVLDNVDTGYRADGDRVLTLDFSLPPIVEGTRYATPESYLQFYEAASNAVSAIPGVRRIGWSTGLPYGSTSELGRWPFEIVGDAPVAPANRPRADFQAASPGYFTTLDLPLVAGRAFSESDTSQSALVCIVNEAFVRRHLGGRDPVGVGIIIEPVFRGAATPRVRHIVGVARQMRGRVEEPEELQVYVPLAQFPYSDTYLVVEPSGGPAEALVAPVRAAIAKIDSNVPVRRERTLTDLASLTTAPHRFRAVMVATFAGLALTLAMVGIFGVLAYSVEQRAREFGVRIALGATAMNVLRLVLGGAARMIGIGAIIGLTTAALLAGSISTFLFGVKPLDPLTFGSAAILLLLTAAVAAAAPALRAARVDPVEAFRTE